MEKPSYYYYDYNEIVDSTRSLASFIEEITEDKCAEFFQSTTLEFIDERYYNLLERIEALDAQSTKKITNFKDIRFSAPEVIYFLKEIGLFNLSFFEGKDDNFKIKILNLITRLSSERDVRGYYNSLKADSEESSKIIGKKHKERVEDFILKNK